MKTEKTASATNGTMAITYACIRTGFTSAIIQIGCFNHRLGGYPGCRQAEQWLCIVYFANCITQPSYNQDLAVSNHRTPACEGAYLHGCIKEHVITTMI